MAVTAIDTIVSDVVLMAEGNGLLARDTDIGDVRALIDPVGGPQQPADSEQYGGDSDVCQAVSATMEDLCQFVIPGLFDCKIQRIRKR
ncbi:MAG: hypothetical protein LC126_21160 [Bryobacterales bacterium]|nr:hypothetical protein [Bryobacterales bacterium]